MSEPAAARTRALAALFLAGTCAAAAAVVVQDATDALPLGLFNDGREAYDWASRAVLLALVLAALLFAAELFRGRRLAAAGLARGILVSLLVAEGVVTCFDVGLVSSGRLAVGGPYREVVGAGGTRVFLKRPHPGSPFGFRSAQPAARTPANRRVLFLGDSYTEGSGRDASCNYPEVAAGELRARGRAGWEGMNAGVAGYGPAEDVALLRFLREEGYRFDAVVLGLFLENDFTDDLPGTERRVVAGINFRFPEVAWLRWLHPLNSRLFRYALFGVRASRLRASRDDFATRGDGACRPPPPLADPLPDGLRELVLRRLARNYRRPLEPLAEAGVGASLGALRAETVTRGVPLLIVVFPDRILADAELRRRLGIRLGDPDYDFGRLRRWVAEHAEGVPVLDLTEALAAAPGSYRPGDTHLSDTGNVVAGRRVGARLAELLPD